MKKLQTPHKPTQQNTQKIKNHSNLLTIFPQRARKIKINVKERESVMYMLMIYEHLLHPSVHNRIISMRISSNWKIKIKIIQGECNELIVKISQPKLRKLERPERTLKQKKFDETGFEHFYGLQRVLFLPRFTHI